MSINITAIKEVRDGLVNAIDVTDVSEKLKQEALKHLIDTVMPNLKPVLETFIKKIKEQGAGETGWCKIRDSYVLPLAMNALFFIVEQILTRTAERTIGTVNN